MKYRNLVMMVWLVGLLGCGTQQDLVSEAKIVVDEQPVIQKKEYSLGEVASHTTKIKLGIPVSVLGIDLGLEVERKFKSKTYTAAMVSLSGEGSITTQGPHQTFQIGPDQILKLTCKYTTQVEALQEAGGGGSLGFISLDHSQGLGEIAKIKVSSQAFTLEQGDGVDDILSFCEQRFSDFHAVSVLEEAKFLLAKKLKLDGNQDPLYRAVHAVLHRKGVKEAPLLGHRWNISPPIYSQEHGMSRVEIRMEKVGFLTGAQLDLVFYHSHGELLHLDRAKASPRVDPAYRTIVGALMHAVLKGASNHMAP